MRVRVKEMLDENGWSVYRLSRAIDADHRTLMRLCNNKSERISLDILDRICSALKCNIEDILLVDKVDLIDTVEVGKNDN